MLQSRKSEFTAICFPSSGQSDKTIVLQNTARASFTEAFLEGSSS